jgi:hypothetical protein
MDRQQLVLGWRLAKLAIESWGTPEFWKFLGWWHQEIHFDIPFDELCEKTEQALNSCFAPATSTTHPYTALSLGSNVSNVSIQNCNFNIPTHIISTPCLSLEMSSENRAVLDCLEDDSVGSYYLPDLNLVLRSSRKPNLLQRFMLNSLLGIEWVNEKDKVPQTKYLSRLLRVLEGNG